LAHLCEGDIFDTKAENHGCALALPQGVKRCPQRLCDGVSVESECAFDREGEYVSRCMCMCVCKGAYAPASLRKRCPQRLRDGVCVEQVCVCVDYHEQVLDAACGGVRMECVVCDFQVSAVLFLTRSEHTHRQ